MINEHTPNSELISAIASRGYPHELAAKEYDKRFPVVAPVDRRSLDCFDACIVGDEVEVLPLYVTAWDRGKVAAISGDGPSRGMRITLARAGGVFMTAALSDRVRWPQPAPFDHAAWVKGLRVGDRCEWKASVRWYAGTIVTMEGGGLGFRYDDNGVVFAWQERAEQDKHRIRPLPPAAPAVDGEYTAERYAASQKVAATWAKEAGRLGMLVGERDATIAAKDAEIAALRIGLSGSRCAVTAKDAEIADIARANLEAARRLNTEQSENVRLRGALAESMRLLGGASDKSTSFLLRVPEQIEAMMRDKAACESLLRAERASVKYLTDRNISVGNALMRVADALGCDPTDAHILAAITDLRASALVVPVEVLKVHPLPWKADGRCIRDMDGRAVIVINSTGYQDEKAIASAIVKAANAGGAK